MKTKYIVGVIIAVVVLAGGGFALMNKSDKKIETQATSTTQTQTTTGSGIITTKTDTTIGSYLADGLGKTLYTYDQDTEGVSNCSGSCLSAWPAFEAKGEATLPANVTIIKRSDGSSQYAYNGMPLYYFVSDTTGKVTGDGVNNFHVAKP